MILSGDNLQALLFTVIIIPEKVYPKAILCALIFCFKCKSAFLSKWIFNTQTDALFENMVDQAMTGNWSWART